jgi:hypothetical protein
VAAEVGELAEHHASMASGFLLVLGHNEIP